MRCFQAMKLTYDASDELNYLIYRYLHESGFTHSSFSFGHESLITHSNIDGSKVRPGALVNIMQKGLQFMEIETHMKENGEVVVCEEPMSLVYPHRCIVKTEDDTTKMNEESGTSKEEKLTSSLISTDNVYTYRGHLSEVIVCTWNPRYPLIASGSGDATARIWSGLIPGENTAGADYSIYPITLKHGAHIGEKERDVTSVEWSRDGNYLASGSYDGIARIWAKNGNLLSEIALHKAPISTLKWNDDGTLLLASSVDNTVSVWDVGNNFLRQHFGFHSAPVLDVDWKDSITFASCSTDRAILVCQVGFSHPLKRFVGHTDEVNSLEWDPSRSILASSSDDKTVKLWSMDHNEPLHTLMDHTQEIYSVKWQPASSGGEYRSSLLASASFDSSVKLWDIERGSCKYTLDYHTDPVYAIEFSPDGKFIASGSFDRYLLLWSTKDGSLVSSYKGTGGIFEISWNTDGNMLVACSNDGLVSVLDLRKLSSGSNSEISAPTLSTELSSEITSTREAAPMQEVKGAQLESEMKQEVIAQEIGVSSLGLK